MVLQFLQFGYIVVTNLGTWGTLSRLFTREPEDASGLSLLHVAASLFRKYSHTVSFQPRRRAPASLLSASAVPGAVSRGRRWRTPAVRDDKTTTVSS